MVLQALHYHANNFAKFCCNLSLQQKFATIVFQPTKYDSLRCESTTLDVVEAATKLIAGACLCGWAFMQATSCCRSSLWSCMRLARTLGLGVLCLTSSENATELRLMAVVSAFVSGCGQLGCIYLYPCRRRWYYFGIVCRYTSMFVHVPILGIAH